MARSTFTRSSLEEEVAKALDSLGIAYTEQFPSRFGFIIDFAIFTDGKKIALEADGPYHDTKERKKKDRFRDYLLRKEGWQIFRVRYDNLSQIRDIFD